MRARVLKFEQCDTWQYSKKGLFANELKHRLPEYLVQQLRGVISVTDCSSLHDMVYMIVSQRS